MGFVLTNGHTYITKKSNGKFTTTYDSGLASIYDTEAKAWNVLSCLPKAYKETGYLPKQNDSKAKTGVEKEILSKVTPPQAHKRSESFLFPTKDSDWLAEFKKNLRIVDQTLGGLKKMYAQVYGDLTRTADDIDDIEHAIELIKPNAAKAFYFEDELRKARKDRRECKDAMMLIELVMKFNLDDWGTGKVDNALRSLDNRSYMPKNRRDLFE